MIYVIKLLAYSSFKVLVYVYLGRFHCFSCEKRMNELCRRLPNERWQDGTGFSSTKEKENKNFQLKFQSFWHRICTDVKIRDGHRIIGFIDNLPYCWFNDVVSIADCPTSIDGISNKCWIGKTYPRSRCGLIYWTISRDWEEPRKPSGRLVDILADIETTHLLSFSHLTRWFQDKRGISRHKIFF
jgi:hypothetical protein